MTGRVILLCFALLLYTKVLYAPDLPQPVPGDDTLYNPDIELELIRLDAQLTAIRELFAPLSDQKELTEFDKQASAIRTEFNKYLVRLKRFRARVPADDPDSALYEAAFKVQSGYDSEELSANLKWLEISTAGLIEKYVARISNIVKTEDPRAVSRVIELLEKEIKGLDSEIKLFNKGVNGRIEVLQGKDSDVYINRPPGFVRSLFMEEELQQAALLNYRKLRAEEELRFWKARQKEVGESITGDQERSVIYAAAGKRKVEMERAELWRAKAGAFGGAIVGSALNMYIAILLKDVAV
jgi:hypothetical protein